MYTEKDLKQIKQQCLDDIRRALPLIRVCLDQIDTRICGYVADAVREDMDTASVYELLCIRKVIRLCYTYHINVERVRKVLLSIEGRWDGNVWQEGGLKFDTPRGAQHVRLMPYQVWCLFGIYAFDVDALIRTEYNGESLLPSEYVDEQGVHDMRRLITEADLFQTRKSGKTEFGAAIDFIEACVLGPTNAQVLVCANSKDQAKIAFNALKKFAFQIDPASMNKAGGKYLRVTADEITFRPGLNRTASIKVMSAGGKKKDGLYASMVHADEHGSASYVKEHSDMQDLVEVCAGSMGPRREKLVLHTTTAGLVNEGPYQIELRGVEDRLIEEMLHVLPDVTIEEHVNNTCGLRTTLKLYDIDRRFSFILRLDPWDFDGDNLNDLNKENLFRKVNRSIGTTVQPTWYHERILDAAVKGHDTRKEVLTKDFNIWQTDRAVQWIKADEIRPLQIDARVDDLADPDWRCFIGCDFSMGDDINGVTYLCYNVSSGEFFADMDAWISEEAFSSSPNRVIYQQAIEGGWLHLCPGATIDDSMVTERIMSVAEKVMILRVGYDPYSSMRFMNTLSAWIFGQGQDPKSYLIPVSQSFGASNGPVQDLTWMVKAPTPLIHFSKCSLWGWEFQNCRMEEDKFGNKRPFKVSGKNAKIDNVVALIMAVKMYNDTNGSINKD